jgi:hypothetical protein
MVKKIDFKGNAEELAKTLDYVGHGGYEEQASVVDDKVYCSCAHCGSADHQYVKVYSLDPLKVSISSYNNEEYLKDIEEFEDVDNLRLYIEDVMAGC